MKMKKYSLVNQSGCVMETCEARSFRGARRKFVRNYGGKYSIVCNNEGNHEQINVIL